MCILTGRRLIQATWNTIRNVSRIDIMSQHAVTFVLNRIIRGFLFICLFVFFSLIGFFFFFGFWFLFLFFVFLVCVSLFAICTFSRPDHQYRMNYTMCCVPPATLYCQSQLFVGWLLNVPATGYSVSQGRICSDKLTCCHTEIEVADPTFYLTQSQYTDTGPTSPSADLITPGAWQGSHWSANF